MCILHEPSQHGSCEYNGSGRPKKKKGIENTSGEKTLSIERQFGLFAFDTVIFNDYFLFFRSPKFNVSSVTPAAHLFIRRVTRQQQNTRRSGSSKYP